MGVDRHLYYRLENRCNRTGIRSVFCSCTSFRREGPYEINYRIVVLRTRDIELKQFERVKSIICLLILAVASTGCVSSETAATGDLPSEKPYVTAQDRPYSFDHIEGLQSDLAGEGLVLPEMIGGLNALQKEVNERIKESNCPVRGKVTVVYVVDEEGKVLDAATAAGIHEICDAIAEEVVKGMPFKPATKNGVPVRIRMGAPVTFY